MTPEKPLVRIVVAPLAGNRQRCLLIAGSLRLPCALGRSGVGRDKREGDGATPAGGTGCRSPFSIAPDRIPRPATRLPVRADPAPDSGWCDDPADRRYNRPVRLPYAARHERLWRDDRLYDVVVVLDYNLARPLPGAGSAIFLHVAAPGFRPTEGCIAVTPAGHARAARPRRPRNDLGSPLTSVRPFRAPKIALPTRMSVAPKAIAVSKSALMPIDSEASPSRLAILARSAKCGAGASSAGGMHISPSMARPCTSRQRATKASASSGRTPAFCGSAPVLTWTRRRGRRPCALISLASAAAMLSRSTVWMASKSATASAPCSTAAARSDAARCPGIAAERRPFRLRLLHAVLAEDPLPGRDDGPDRRRLEGLGYGDQAHRTRRPPGGPLRRSDLRADFRQARTASSIRDLP